MLNLGLLLPEMTLAVLALAVMLADMLLPPSRSRWLYHLSWFSAAVVLIGVAWGFSRPGAQGLGSLWVADPFSQFFKMTTLLAAVFGLLLSLDYKALPLRHAGTFAALMLFSTAGLMFLVSATDLLLVFVALELVSISSFVLAGFERANPKSNEGAIKYFLFGAFSSAIMVFGLSLYYGATGTTRLAPVLAAPGPLMILALVLVFLGLSFKASLAPMHFWVPDAYEGAPIPVAAFLSIAPKLATFAVLLRIYTTVLPASQYELQPLIGLIAGLTMTIGNFTAFFQDDVKRLLAYSSVAQAGYLLIGVAVGTPLGLEGVMMYSFVYAAMNLGAFAVVQAVGEQAGCGLDAFNGLSKRSLGLALALTFCLLSLAGLPPMAGFMGKLYIFSSAVEAGRWWLAVVGVLNSVASVYFYFRIVHRMFFRGSEEPVPLQVGPYVYGSVAVAVAGVIIFGIHPEPLISGVRASAHLLP